LAGTRPLAAQATTPSITVSPAGEGWPTYGGDPGGLRLFWKGCVAEVCSDDAVIPRDATG
jgi:hypothetical protein